MNADSTLEIRSLILSSWRLPDQKKLKRAMSSRTGDFSMNLLAK
jgi:hypothetical protein